VFIICIRNYYEKSIHIHYYMLSIIIDLYMWEKRTCYEVA